MEGEGGGDYGGDGSDGGFICGVGVVGGAYNTLITAYLKAKDIRAAGHLFDEMQQYMRWAHEYGRKAGLLDRMVHVANAVMDMYCKCGDVDSARVVFQRMQHRSVVSWNTMITIELFQEMSGHGLEPNAATFLGVLGCCAHAGAVDVGREIFLSMQSDYGIEPVIEHYGCMVYLLGRSGLLEEAHTLIRDMPMKPNAAAWGALLSACRAHAGLGFAEVALKELINLEPFGYCWPIFMLRQNGGRRQER